MKDIIINHPGELLGVIFLMASFMILSYYYRKKQEEQQSEGKARMDSYIVALSTDYECVDIVTFRENKMNDEIIEHHYISNRFQDLIPGWEDEKGMSKRLNRIMESIVYPDDRDMFYNTTRREEIFKSFKTGDVHTTEFRVAIDGEIEYYQLKFVAIRDDKGVATGMAVGIRNVDEIVRREVERQMARKHAKTAEL